MAVPLPCAVCFNGAVKAAALLLLLAATAAMGEHALPRLNVLPGSLTVSGVSSGGYMATQYQVAYAKDVIGAGIIAAGPWLCAQGSLFRALDKCLRGRPGRTQRGATRRSGARQREGGLHRRSVLARTGPCLCLSRLTR
jgi:poly(3-hydroxybutyrate) depolymerase